MKHVARVDFIHMCATEVCHTYGSHSYVCKRGTSHIFISSICVQMRQITCVYTYGWDMSHIWMRHVTRMNLIHMCANEACSKCDIYVTSNRFSTIFAILQILMVYEMSDDEEVTHMCVDVCVCVCMCVDTTHACVHMIHVYIVWKWLIREWTWFICLLTRLIYICARTWPIDEWTCLICMCICAWACLKHFHAVYEEVRGAISLKFQEEKKYSQKNHSLGRVMSEEKLVKLSLLPHVIARHCTSLHVRHVVIACHCTSDMSLHVIARHCTAEGARKRHANAWGAITTKC